MKKQVLKQKTFKLEEDKYNLFKELCKLNYSDANKEIRKFINSYVEEHKDKLNKLF